MLLSLLLYRETYWSRIRRWIVQNVQIVIFSVVKTCKQCLPTASASSPSSLTGLRPWTTLGDFHPPHPLGYSPPQWKFRRRHWKSVEHVWLERRRTTDTNFHRKFSGVGKPFPISNPATAATSCAPHPEMATGLPATTIRHHKHPFSADTISSQPQIETMHHSVPYAVVRQGS